METVELRPLSLGELLDRTFTLYRRHFWLFVGIMAVPSSFTIPVNVLFISMQGSLAPSGPPSPAQIASIFGGAFVFLIIFYMAYAVAMGAAAYAISQSYLGQTATVRGSYRKVSEKFWRLIGLTINVMLRIFGILLLIGAVVGGVAVSLITGVTTLAPMSGTRIALAIVLILVILAAYVGALVLMVYLAIRYSVSIPVLMLENRAVLDSIRRSIQLTAGRRWQIFVAFLLAGIIGYVGIIIFQVPFLIPIMISMMHNNRMPSGLAFLYGVSGAVGGSITGPISMIVLVLCYYDARIRKEAFDLQFMMSALDKPATAEGTISPA